MKLENFWIAFSILGIIAIIIPAATMGTDIFFDLNLFLFVVGIATLYSFGSGGSKLRILKILVKVHLLLVHLGFLLVLHLYLAWRGKKLLTELNMQFSQLVWVL
jgi:hypothetical protein